MTSAQEHGLRRKTFRNYPLDVGILVQYDRGAIAYCPMPFLNPKYKEHVGSLGAKLPGATEITPQGTCFFVRTFNSTGVGFDYVVTAKHVVEALERAGGPAYLRLNRGRVGQFNQGVLDVPIPTKGWLLHDDKSVDLAVLPMVNTIERIEDAAKKGEIFRYLRMNIDTLADATALGFAWPPFEGEDVIFVAMTTQFQGVAANLPTVRRGGIALVSDEPISGHYGPSEYYVIEAQVYPGNSGAPVWVAFTDPKDHVQKAFTLGVLVFSYPTEEELKRVHGVTNAYYNLGLSLVVPIEKVLEIVKSKKETDRRDQKKGHTAPGIPLSDEPEAVFDRTAMEAALRKVSRPDGKEVIERQGQASSET